MRKKKIGIIILCLLVLMSGAFLLRANTIKGLAAEEKEASPDREASISEIVKAQESRKGESAAVLATEETHPEWPSSKGECSEEQLIEIAEYVISKDTTGKYDDSQFPGQVGDALTWAKYVKAWHEYFQDLPPEEAQQVPYFEQLYRDASKEEQMQLQRLHPDISAAMMYPRDTMIITGKMPADTPRLTLDQAKDICDQIEVSSFETLAEMGSYIYRCFNKIAGAPDFYGGSGLITIVYYLHDNDHSELICIFEGAGVMYEKWEGEECYREALYFPPSEDR